MRRVLKKYRANAADFCMEISESAMFDSRPEVGANIEKLRQSGFLIAIDDFGVEMSSLKKLENLKVDWVKLDRSFIEQSKDDFLIGGVVGTLVQYAARGAFKMIAEGIEDEVVLEYVKERAIPYGQGYHFGKPLPPQDYGI
jgi:EAL domain-containing protein (putative c-di-GMP-specific phosphodiesterase class I)